MVVAGADLVWDPGIELLEIRLEIRLVDKVSRATIEPGVVGI